MKLFVVAAPMFNAEMAVKAYRMEYQNAEKLFGTAQGYTVLDGAMNSPGIDLLNAVGIEPFTGGKPIFVDINQYVLLAGVPNNIKIAPAMLVCVLSNDIPINNLYLGKSRELKRQGFSIALEGLPFSYVTKPFYNLADYIILDAAADDWRDTMGTVVSRYPAASVIFSGITSYEVFDDLKRIPLGLFGGTFYSNPITKDLKHDLTPFKANALQLLKLIGEEDFELEDVSKVIQKDLSLSVSLLKFINSPAIGTVSKVNSIQSAVALLGQTETRKWVTVAVSTYLAKDKPDEITKLSLVRARFAENLAVPFAMEEQASSLFMVGLFSLLDIILDKPMESAVEAISISDAIKEALAYEKGPLYTILCLIKSYEKADWSNVSYIIVTHNADAVGVQKAFIDALIWYKELLRDIQSE